MEFILNKYTLIIVSVIIIGIVANNFFNKIENFAHEEGHAECKKNGENTSSGFILCDEAVCSNNTCCSNISTHPTGFLFFRNSTCVSYDEAMILRKQKNVV